MKKLFELLESKPKLMSFLFLAILGGTFFTALLVASIMERRAEAIFINKPKNKITELEARNELWGKNFPQQYNSYLKTKEMSFKSKYNGNGFVDMLEEDPNLVILWAGYGFSLDYNQPRGHAYAVEDIRNTLRTGSPKGPNEGAMPNTCWSCKSPDVPRMMKKVGVSEFYKGKWASRGHEINNPIGCADCHDNETMDLKITRPALIEAFERMGKDITKSTHQEMRSLVCAQCHVEYYFKGEGKYLTFPWDKGLSVEDMEKYYDEVEFSDWTHALSKAPMLKAQHPEYETWTQGIHAKRGVSCADCHMPYVSEGGVKYSDHHAQSPLNNINKSCQVCHRESEETLRNNVYSMQDKVFNVRMEVEKHLVMAHVEAKLAWDKGATEEEMKPILKDIRHAQWRWDFAVASHGASFHAALEMGRILGQAMEKSAEARRKLAKVLFKYGVTADLPFPDISTKEKAQKYIGVDIEKLKNDKEEFKKKIIPEWDKNYNPEENAREK